MNIRERLKDAYPDEELLFADGFDEAIIGVQDHTFGTSGPRLVYSVRRALALLRTQLGPSPEPLDDEAGDEYATAREFFDFNVSGAYVGPQTPVWCEDEYLDQD